MHIAMTITCDLAQNMLNHNVTDVRLGYGAKVRDSAGLVWNAASLQSRVCGEEVQYHSVVTDDTGCALQNPT